MRSDPILISALCLLGLSTACEDLGECKDEAEGRRPVLVGGQVMYAGQAVIVKTCASCHSEGATGELRVGAPAHLNFDLQPLSATEENDAGVGVVDEAALARLRAGQRRVFQERESIWKQVAKDLMPPKGVSEAFRKLDLGQRIDSVSGGKCVLGEKLGTISEGEAREELRSWLACGSPIVEANAKFLATGMPGKIGDQFPTCAGEEPVPPTFENVFNMVFADCAVCHVAGGFHSAFDLGTLDVAYATLLGPDGNGAAQSCTDNPAPMVMPRDAANSYLMAKLEKDVVRCGERMPSRSGLGEDKIDLVRQWINAGAPGPGANSSEMPEGDAGI